MPNKKILLICWDFPPNQGIGGRRWAKFAKYISKKGYEIHVIKSQPTPFNKISSWFKDVNKSNIHLHEINMFWVCKWLNDYNSKFSFIKTRLAKIAIKTFFKGTIYDKAIGVEKQFLKLAQDIILKHKIKNVIVTGAPFNLIYYTALLKQKHPNVNIIADYRDPWLTAMNYGMQNLTPQQKSEEQRKQNYVFETVNFITTPNQFLVEEVKQSYTGNNKIVAEFNVLQHAFDQDDIYVSFEKQENKSDTIKLVYGGSLYIGTEPYLDLLSNSISEFKIKFPNKKLEIIIYTEDLIQEKIFKMHSDVVSFFKPVGDEIFKKIEQCDFILIFLSEHNKDFKTTKFYEFLPYKKPYLYFGPAGYVSHCIVDDNIGFVVNASDDFNRILGDESWSKKCNGFKEIDKYSLNTITDTLIDKFI